jgi:hypothetical protein
LKIATWLSGAEFAGTGGVSKGTAVTEGGRRATRIAGATGAMQSLEDRRDVAASYHRHAHIQAYQR